jgi:phosphoglycolate phosphatase
MKLIIFDFDGTLGDTRANILLTMRMTLRKLGLPEKDDETIAATIGIPLGAGFRQMFPDLSADEENLCVKTYRAIVEENKKDLVPALFPHVKETLAALKELGYILTVASSRSSASLDGFLRDMDIADCISFVLGADNVTNAKPHPEPVLRTLKEFGVDASDAIVVGDMPVDILMGKAAGATTCAVSYGNASREALEDAGADIIIDDFSKLKAIRVIMMERVFDRVQADLNQLKEYQESGQWLEDFEADERGEIPQDIKRGILSEDALYNLLEGPH